MAVKIEPYKKNVSINVVRAVWHTLRDAFSRNPAMVERLMTLYLGDGVSYMMSIDGQYMACDFNRLSRKGLNYNHPDELIKAVIQSGVFTLGLADNNYGLSWFASPLYLNERELKKAMDATSSTSQSVAPTVGLSNSIINYTGNKNIILSGRKTASPQPVGERKDNDNENDNDNQSLRPSSNRMDAPLGGRGASLPPYEVRNVEVEQFIKQMYTDTEFFFPLREMLTAKELDGKQRPAEEVFTVDQAREILNRLMYYHVKPYFMEQLRFFKYPGLDGRREWLRNWLYGDKGKKIIKAATNYCRQKWKREEQAAFNDKRKHVRDNHPLSPHEWTDANTGKRYYSESPTETVMLPDDAPPRPTETAHWNKFTNHWK